MPTNWTMWKKRLIPVNIHSPKAEQNRNRKYEQTDDN